MQWNARKQAFVLPGDSWRVRSRMGDERLWAALVVLVLHVAGFAWLLNFDPGYSAFAARPASIGKAIQVVFLTRSTPSVAPVAPAGPARSRTKSPRKHVDLRATFVPRPDRNVVIVAPGDGLPTPSPQPRSQLDLALPSAYTEIDMPSGDVLADRGAIDYQATRFEGSWTPQGNALTQLAWESKIAGTLLSAFGGPPRRCTEVEKRLRKPECLPDDYEEQYEDWQRQRDQAAPL